MIGSGLIWDTVYERLQDHDVIVLGGRATGVSESSTPLVGTFSTLSRNRSAWAAWHSAEVGSRWFSVVCADGSPIGYSFKTNQLYDDVFVAVAEESTDRLAAITERGVVHR